MAQIRHLAIRTENPEQLAAFYMEAFGLKELHRGSHPGHPGGKTVHLTDGYFELAILDNSAQQSPNGIYHFGLLVDDMQETLDKIKKCQPGKTIKERPKGTPFAEQRVSDPEGNLIDLSVHGYLDYQPIKKG